MDARALLDRVAEAYRNLTSLAVESRVIVETGDEDENNRRVHKVKGYFLAPDHYRHETSGRHGHISVVNGSDWISYTKKINDYRRGSMKDPEHSNGKFRWELPHGMYRWFSGINDHIATAEWLRDEENCHVVSVGYDPTFLAAHITMCPIEFWIDSRTFLVMRYRANFTNRRPRYEVTCTQTVDAISMEINQPIDPKVFELERPEGAADSLARFGGLGAGGSGSNAWDGNTFVQHSKMSLRGLALEFERRLTVSEDKRELQIEETVTAPGGNLAHWAQSIALMPPKI